MKRRNVLLGFGAAASGVGAAVGTGAFSAAQLDNRNVNISVVNDSDGLVGLVPNDRIAGVDDDGGKLSISLDDHGVNVDALYQFGAFVDDTDFPEGELGDQFDPVLYDDGFDVDDNFRSAFAVVNQTTREMEVEFELNIDYGQSEDQPQFVFQLHDGTEQLDAIDSPDELTGDATLGSGEAIGVSFSIDSSNSEVGDGLTGSFSVSARESGS
jgi:hypothetical protein